MVDLHSHFYTRATVNSVALEEDDLVTFGHCCMVVAFLLTVNTDTSISIALRVGIISVHKLNNNY